MKETSLCKCGCPKGEQECSSSSSSTMSSRFSLIWILLILFTGPRVSGSILKGVVGQNITVPCSYHVKGRADITTMCWGRGACPASKCWQPIIWTDGWKVTTQSSERYQLEGNLPKGNVSLTIVNAEEADSGTYCCRVEIPGLFNDQTTNHRVVIEKARITTPSPHTYTSEQTSAPGTASDSSLTITTTWPSVSGSEAPQTAYNPSSSTNFISDRSDITADLQNVSESAHSAQNSENGIYIGIGICVVLLVILILALFLSRHYLYNMKKLSNFPSSVMFWRLERAGNQNALEIDMHAEENIYTIH
uniref:Hepatitis A virus cellular receptor 2 n=3 Tax=Dromaius novaehollandiae TaxID=8790 RepID=A0A8C4J3D0_DRONO|nr:hepatitis A virus cellular receptor 2 isoform X1 [Dromaius novaehollandiae]